jgi:hypothetical protein
MTAHARRLSPLAEQWSIIADSLDLRVVAPFSVQLPSGQRIDADVLLMDFGALKGMLLVTDAEKVLEHQEAITSAGYGFSILSEPGNTPPASIELDVIVEILRDWGWAGSTDAQPAWLDSQD